MTRRRAASPIDVRALAAGAREAPLGRVIELVVDPRSLAGIAARATLEGWGRRGPCRK